MIFLLAIKEELPFCWYFGIQSADKIEKKVDFINKEDIQISEFETDKFIDPLYAMIGFCMRNPKVNRFKLLYR